MASPKAERPGDDDRPAVTARRLAAAMLLVAAAGGCGGRGRPNVLLIVIDTARADRFSFDAYGRATSPRLASFAGEGAVYEGAYTPSPWTLPAHASLFTGLYPSSHGADSGHLRLDEEHVTLAEAFAGAGYRTVGYTANPWIGKDHGFDQGFQGYEEIWRNVPAAEEDAGARLINARIGRFLTWRDGNPEARRQPFFLFVNYMEPHLPHDPPEPERRAFLPSGARDADVQRLRQLKHPEDLRFILGLTALTGDDLAILSGLYDGEIAYADRRVGEGLDLLRRRGLLDRTVVAITSDHGEALGEHHFLDHKMNVYENLLRIPLVLRYPPAVRAGQRIGETVMLHDLYPTLLGLAGIAPPSPADGDRRTTGGPEAVPLPGVGGTPRGGPPRDRPGPGAPGGGPRPVIAEFARPVQFLEVMREAVPGADLVPWGRALVAWRIGDEKLHWASDGRHRLFDLHADPGEDHDLASERPDRVATLAAAVEAWLRRPGARPPLAPAP